MNKLLITIKITFVFSCLLFGSVSCTNDATDLDKSVDSITSLDISNSLHVSFNTSEWNRVIDCSQLDFDPLYLNDSTSYIYAISQSTSLIFFFSFPADSSVMAKQSNLKKYPIRSYAGNLDGYFEYSHKLPYNVGSSNRLISEYGFSDSTYNQIVSIKYIESNATVAKFEVKGKYAMIAYVLNPADSENTSTKRKITGTYNFKVGVKRR